MTGRRWAGSRSTFATAAASLHLCNMLSTLFRSYAPWWRLMDCQGTAAFLPNKITIGQGPWERAVCTQNKQHIEWRNGILQGLLWLVSAEGGGGRRMY